MDQNIKRIVEQYASVCKNEEIELLKTLGQIPAPSHHEDMRAAFCRDWFLAQGAKDVTIDKAKNVICKLGPQDGDLVVFEAHTDIAFPDTETLTIRETEGKLHATGIGDDKAALANMLMAAKYLLQNGLQPRCGMLLVANSCEEGLGNLDGTKEIFSTYAAQIKAFYSFDGYTSQCTTSAVGSYRYKITCKTAGGHSFLHFGAANAIEILCRMVQQLYAIVPPTQAKTTYNVGRIEGGTTVNSIAQEASMLYEFRSTSQMCLEEMERNLNEVVRNCSELGGEIIVELLGVRPGNGPIDEAKLKAYTDKTIDIIQTFYNGELDFSAYSTDSNIPLSLGILANTVGTVQGAGAHTYEEWMDLNSLDAGVKIALSLMLQYV